jgi:acetyl-CoA C-acetyltransferase
LDTAAVVAYKCSAVDCRGALWETHPMIDSRTPILVGVGQRTNRAESVDQILEPLELMALSAQDAADDTGVALLPAVDSVTVINLISHPYADPAAQLAQRLGCSPSERMSTSMGGNSPQWRVNETAERICRGEVSVAVIAGAEAFHSLKIARRDGVQLDWGPTGDPGRVVGDVRGGSNDIEKAHKVHLPIRIYPLFENALRAARGLTIDQHTASIGKLCAGLSRVAAANPYAWFRDEKSADQITADSPDNRMICFPYRKYMNAIMAVDQGSALIMTSVGRARELGIPESKWVYLRGCGDAHDHWFVSDRVNFHSSPAIRLAGRRAMEQAGIGANDIDFVDVYSCFPSALQIGARMLGITDDGSVDLTLTGGLPYHGGPGSNYTTHAIAQLVARLRAASKPRYAIATGVGWYMTKHAVGVYSNEPPRIPWRRHDVAADQAELDAEVSPPLVARAHGPATIETYTVAHDRDGSPTLGIAAVRLDDGSRAWANVVDHDVLCAMESHEFVGRPVRVRSIDGEQANRLEI